jgi:hypothetical protein
LAAFVPWLGGDRCRRERLPEMMHTKKLKGPKPQAVSPLSAGGGTPDCIDSYDEDGRVDRDVANKGGRRQGWRGKE